MRTSKQGFFYLCDLWPRPLTLRKTTWKQLLDQAPGLIAIRKERNKENRYLTRNSFKGAFTQAFFAFLILVGLYLIPGRITDQYFAWLELFRFSDDQKAFATISEVMGATATIIGLSFVVIGFLFDIVKDKTQRTLNEMFRATKLYYVFAISVVSIMVLVSINLIKYTVASYVAKNLAICASIILLIEAGSIAYLFYQLLRFFNPEQVAKISSGQMLKMAKFRMLDDRFSKASGEVYQKFMEDLGCEEKSIFASFLSKGKPSPVWFTLSNSKDVDLLNIHFPVLHFIAKRIIKRSKESGFAGLRFGMTIRPKQGIISFENGTIISSFERKILSAAYLTSTPPSDADDFDLMKIQLEKRFLKASADGDLEAVQQALQDIEKLYEIFYQSNS